MAIPGFKADAMESAVGSDGEVVRSALSSSLDIRVAEALADYCDKVHPYTFRATCYTYLKLC
eukprot:m.44957 g.44957  ORF g.44957 m.44957 type:complete len:62 (-) comp6596_c0_seq1:949-1134(-)